MARIKLSKGGFTPIPEGEHVFKIVKANYDEDFGKIEVDMVTVDGKKHIERYSLIRNDGELNEGALNAFSYFAKTALNDFSVEEIEPKDLEGRYMKCTVEHNVQPHRDDPKKTVTFINLKDNSPAEGFGEAPEGKSDGGFNLDELLADEIPF